MHHDISERDHHITVLIIAFGQLIDHDMTLGAVTTSQLIQLIFNF